MLPAVEHAADLPRCLDLAHNPPDWPYVWQKRGSGLTKQQHNFSERAEMSSCKQTSKVKVSELVHEGCHTDDGRSKQADA